MLTTCLRIKKRISSSKKKNITRSTVTFIFPEQWTYGGYFYSAQEKNFRLQEFASLSL